MNPLPTYTLLRMNAASAVERLLVQYVNDRDRTAQREPDQFVPEDQKARTLAYMDKRIEELRGALRAIHG